MNILPSAISTDPGASLTSLKFYLDTCSTVQSLEEQHAQLQKRLDLHREELERHKQEVARHERQLKECFAQEKALSASISRHRSFIEHDRLTLTNPRQGLSALPSLAYLPAEIFGEIFLHFVEDVSGSTACVDIPNQYGDFITLWRQGLLMCVCRKWRDIMLSTPILWRTVTIWPSPRRGHWEQIEARLERAGSSLLRLHCIRPKMSPRIDAMLATLLPRTASLSLLYQEALIPEPLPSIRKFSGGHQFQELSLRVGTVSWITPTWVRGLLNRSQPLRRIEIDMGDVYLQTPTLSRVRYMSLGRIMRTSLLPLLQNAPCLERLDIVRVLNSGASIPTTPTTHSVLADLRIYSSDCDVLEDLSFPCLRRLTLGGGENILSSPSDIRRLCQRSQCALTSLALTSSRQPLMNDDLSQILELQPNLYSLILSLEGESGDGFSGVANSVFDLLSTGALAHLHTLSLPISFEQLQTTRAMLEARRAHQDSGVLSKMLSCEIGVQIVPGPGAVSQIREAEALRPFIDGLCESVQ